MKAIKIVLYFLLLSTIVFSESQKPIEKNFYEYYKVIDEKPKYDIEILKITGYCEYLNGKCFGLIYVDEDFVTALTKIDINLSNFSIINYEAYFANNCRYFMNGKEKIVKNIKLKEKIKELVRIIKSDGKNYKINKIYKINKKNLNYEKVYLNFIVLKTKDLSFFYIIDVSNLKFENFDKKIIELVKALETEDW